MILKPSNFESAWKVDEEIAEESTEYDEADHPRLIKRRAEIMEKNNSKN